MRYGAPYKGSKNAIAAWIVELLPPGKRLVDLFAGGCAVTHAALLSGKWDCALANDIGAGPELFARAVAGEYREEKRWISREDFFRLKDSDPYVKYCWSFGNDGRSYMYSRELEPYKRAVHMEIMAESLEERYLAHRQAVRSLCQLTRSKVVSLRTKENLPSLESLQSLQSLERLERLESLERLQSLQSLESLERLQSLQSLERLERLQSLESRFMVRRGDYREVAISEGDVLFCDIPYQGTEQYGTGGFDYEAFYTWAERQTLPTYISSYTMPEDRFRVVAEKTRCGHLSTKNAHYVQERIFVPVGQCFVDINDPANQRGMEGIL